MLCDDFLQQLYSSANHAQLEGSYVAAILLVNICLWFSGQRWLVWLLVGMFALMQLLQLSHISFTGEPLTPYDISKLFAEREEIGVATVHAAPHHWPVLVVWALPWGLTLWLFQRYLQPRPWPLALGCSLVVLLALASKPNRATYRDMIFFMPGPTRSSLHNSLNAFSYWAVRMAFRHQTVQLPEFQPYRLQQLPVADVDNLVLLITDSVRYDRLQLAGGERETTPQLQLLLQRGELQARQGLAASVATGASLPLLLNSVREPGNLVALESGVANLFAQARRAGFKTFWLSTQESKMLNGLGVEHVDVVVTREDEPLDLAQQGDRLVLEWLQEYSLAEKNLIAVHVRSAHIPYQAAYRHERQRYHRWPDDQGDSAQRDSNAYDNALLYLDQLAADIYRWSQQLPGRTAWVMTSDHGQMLGEQGRWGHNRLTPMVASVPVLAAGAQADSLPAGLMSHYQLSKWLLQRLGAQLHNPNEVAGVHYFQSEKLYQDNLYRMVLSQPDGVYFCQPSLISRYPDETACEQTERVWPEELNASLQ
ncbi:hypothetical protein GCM10011297_30360 [Bacterioplanes sanyensis]|nr:hypothetical protein GCM10011297_30360 [Bacterioplanes sanyensis]